MQKNKKIQHFLEYVLLRLFGALVKLLPQRAAIGLGRKTALLVPVFLKNRMHITRENLSRAYGDALSPPDRDKVITQLLQLQGESLIESIIFKHEDVKHNIRIDGMEHLHTALQQKKGVILLGPHFDMWELAGYVFGTQLEDAATIYKPLKNDYINTYLAKTRAQSNMGLIPSKNALRPVLSRLRKGLAVVILYDQNAGRSGLPVTLFNHTALTYSAPAVFALKTGCAVIPAYMIKEPGYRKHRLVIHEPFPLLKPGHKEQALIANTPHYRAAFGMSRHRQTVPGQKGLSQQD
ncbi:MAG: hypothetical protein GY868_02990, partial [Deltaproteobacteria bacterium]|nr:hypothetical protein [Deltaproteobacteria bacterium]